MKRTLCTRLFRATSAVAILALTASAFAAPLSYTGGTYTQNFDALPSTGASSVANRGPNYINPSWSGVTGSNLEGWQFANPDGSSGSTEYRAQNGGSSGSAGRGVVSFGATGSSERALGMLLTSNQIPTFGLVLTNNTAQVLTSFTLSFTGEQWRRGDADPQSGLYFSYGLASDIGASLTSYAPLDFTSPTAAPLNSALDGNLPANQVAKSATITGLNWGIGQTLVLKWNSVELSGQDDGLAIDNLSFSAVPEPSSFALAAVGLVGAAGIVWRRRRSA
ncbi:MAG: PEP-CTERM sorting domain-containing protein [Planctomycetaceae bacterium]|nr:PEP-CTERM sorting domain-containing protein [Planctomycetaceae bacterium]